MPHHFWMIPDLAKQHHERQDDDDQEGKPAQGNVPGEIPGFRGEA